MTPALGRALFAAIGALEALRLRYAIVGGLAVGAWGVSRATDDADLYADLPDAARRPLERALVKRGFHVPAMEAELRSYGVFRSKSKQGVFVDIFDAVGPLGEAILERRRRVAFAGRTLYLVAPEELALLKSFSDRARDHEDLLNLVAVRRDRLDVSYLRRWARILDASIGGDEVTARIETALAGRSAKRRPAPRKKRK